jgi:hypothetical protein
LKIKIILLVNFFQNENVSQNLTTIKNSLKEWHKIFIILIYKIDIGNNRIAIDIQIIKNN